MNKPTYENVPVGVDEIEWKSIMISDEESKRVRSLLKKVNTVECFKYEGVYYKGNKLKAAMDFAHSTTFPADFHVWLQDNYEILK